VVNNLVFVKSKLKIDEPIKIAKILQLFWITLDLFGPQDDLESALSSRYENLHNGLKKLFLELIIGKEDAKVILEYARRTIFGHLHLYLACITLRKQEKKVKKV